MRVLWQRAMIGAARSPRIKRFMQSARATSFLRDKYVAGASADDGTRRAVDLLESDGIRSSLFFMGEYVDSLDLVRENVEQKLKVIDNLGRKRIDVHVSVDPTQIGHHVDPSVVAAHAERIATAVREAMKNRKGIHCLMFDMEDASLNDPTIALHDTLQDRGLPVALTLQAYMRRTEADLAAQISRSSRIRLVKGAFAADAGLAFQSQREIKENFRRLIGMMLSAEAKVSGFYPIIATHDETLHAFAINVARHNGWKAGEYEFEMLLGVRENVARSLAADGERVRLYVPFGRDWWPHAVRRIGENPANVLLLIRSLVN